MAATLAGNWWVFLMRGVLAILLALFAFTRPDITFVFLTALFGAYAFFDGIFALAASLEGSTPRRQLWALLLEGIVGITIGVLTFTAPFAVELLLVWSVAFWAILTGVLEIMAAFRLRGVAATEWFLGLAGVLSIVLGIIVFARPVAGALFLAWTIGVYALLFGLSMFAVAVRLRRWARGRRMRRTSQDVATGL
jgi:uncharacterized membrane protein HdeD (DUF308 family)